MSLVRTTEAEAHRVPALFGVVRITESEVRRKPALFGMVMTTGAEVRRKPALFGMVMTTGAEVRRKPALFGMIGDDHRGRSPQESGPVRRPDRLSWGGGGGRGFGEA